jgi:hypothetical protein
MIYNFVLMRRVVYYLEVMALHGGGMRRSLPLVSVVFSRNASYKAPCPRRSHQTLAYGLKWR